MNNDQIQQIWKQNEQNQQISCSTLSNLMKNFSLSNSQLAFIWNLILPSDFVNFTTFNLAFFYINFTISSIQKQEYLVVFRQYDPTNSGFIDGDRARNVFIQSGLNQSILAHIWQLSDSQNHGKLNPDEFCVAMHLIHCKLKGIDLPRSLPESLVPSSTKNLSDALSMMKNSVINDLVNKPKKPVIIINLGFK